jgi:hypothetical protein
MTTISELITPSHEAHFRLELWWSLPHTGEYRHSISKSHAGTRIQKWKDLLPVVLQDRHDNEETAFMKRQADYITAGGVVAKAADVPDDNPDEMYW